MSTYPHLLPPNATAMERGLAGPLGRINDIPTPVDTVFRWDTCPEALLPWLAWALSVDIWSDSWPAERKRQVIKESFSLHRKKGTLYAIKRYLDFADAKLVRAITPPDKAFAGAALTADERMSWLGRFPQIRIYNFRDRAARAYGAFTTAALHLPKAYLGDSSNTPVFFPYDTGAWEYWGRRAFLWDKGPHHLATGEETALRWIERTSTTKTGTAQTYEQVLIPGSHKGIYPGASHIASLYPTEGDAGDRIVSVAIQSSYSYPDETLQRRFSVGGGLTPINVWPEKVAERSTAVRGVHIFGCSREAWIDPETKERKRLRGYLAGYMPESDARLQLYDRLYLHDPDRLPDGRTVTSHLGNFRLGMPSFHMQLDVQITGKRQQRQFGRFVWGHTLATSQQPLHNARAAINRSKSRRDKVLMNTALHRPISTRDRVRTSDRRRTGEIIRSTI